MKSINIRDNGDNTGHEIVIVEEGEVFAVIPMTDRALLDLDLNLAKQKQTAWGRLRKHLNIQINDKPDLSK